MLRRVASALTVLLFACSLPSLAQSLLTDISVSRSPSGVAVNPANNRIYVSLTTATGNAVAVIDGSTNTVVANVPTRQAFVITANVTTGRVYTAGCNFSHNPPNCGVTVIDGATNSVIANIPIDASNGIGLKASPLVPSPTAFTWPMRPTMRSM